MELKNARLEIQQDWMNKEGRNLHLYYLGHGSFVMAPEGQTLGSTLVLGYLSQRGYPTGKEKQIEGVPNARDKIHEIIRDFRINDFLPVSSYLDPGIYKYKSQKTLVLNGPKRTELKEDNWPNIDQALSSSFPLDREYFETWLQSAVRDYYHPERYRPGPLLVIMGTGHDEIQRHLIDATFGGSMNPFDFFIERGARPKELLQDYVWSIGSTMTVGGFDKTRYQRFNELRQLCRSRLKNFLNYGLPVHCRANICLDLKSEIEQMMGNFVFEPQPDLLVIACQAGKMEPAKIAVELPAYLWDLEQRKASTLPKDGYFSPTLRDACFRMSLECDVYNWLAKLYEVEKASGSMEIAESYLVGRMEMAGISRTSIQAALKQKPMGMMMKNLSLRYPENFQSVSEDSKVWRISNLRV